MFCKFLTVPILKKKPALQKVGFYSKFSMNTCRHICHKQQTGRDLNDQILSVSTIFASKSA